MRNFLQGFSNRLGKSSAPNAVQGRIEPMAQAREFKRVVMASDLAPQDARYSGVGVAEGETIAVSDLPAFTRTLARGRVGKDAQQTICPIQIDNTATGGKRVFAVVMLKKMLNSDVAEEVIASLSREFDPAEPCIYIATQNVLSELVNAAHDAEDGKAAIASRNSSMWAHFEDAAKFALETGASDLHFKVLLEEEYSNIGFRIDGEVVKPRRFRMQSKLMASMMSYLYGFHGNFTTTNYWSANEALQCQLDEIIGGRHLTFRWAQLPIRGGVKVVLRMSRMDSSGAYTSLGEGEGGVGYPGHQVAVWDRNIRSAGGGTLIAGVVNSGKSKTLNTVLSSYPDGQEINTAEDPIEDILSNGNQHSTARTLSDKSDSDPFAPFRLQNKRMDPDVTMISELRDTLTAGTFRDSVLSGQRVFSTIHASDALSIFERLASDEFGLTRDMIALPNFLKLLVYQALVAKTCDHCKLDPTSGKDVDLLKSLAAKSDLDERIAPLLTRVLRVTDGTYLGKVESLFGLDVKKMRVRNPLGCEHCAREGVPELNGVRGRLLVAQMVEPTLDMLALVRDAKNIDLYQLYRSQRAAGFDSDNSDGKTPMQIAMYRVSRGELCITEVEKRFQTLDAYAHHNKQYEGKGR